MKVLTVEFDEATCHSGGRKDWERADGCRAGMMRHRGCCPPSSLGFVWISLDFGQGVRTWLRSGSESIVRTVRSPKYAPVGIWGVDESRRIRSRRGDGNGVGEEGDKDQGKEKSLLPCKRNFRHKYLTTLQKQQRKRLPGRPSLLACKSLRSQVQNHLSCSRACGSGPSQPKISAI